MQPWGRPPFPQSALILATYVCLWQEFALRAPGTVPGKTGHFLRPPYLSDDLVRRISAGTASSTRNMTAVRFKSQNFTLWDGPAAAGFGLDVVRPRGFWTPRVKSESSRR